MPRTVFRSTAKEEQKNFCLSFDLDSTEQTAACRWNFIWRSRWFCSSSSWTSFIFSVWSFAKNASVTSFFIVFSSIIRSRRWSSPFGWFPFIIFGFSVRRNRSFGVSGRFSFTSSMVFNSTVFFCSLPIRTRCPRVFNVCLFVWVGWHRPSRIRRFYGGQFRTVQSIIRLIDA